MGAVTEIGWTDHTHNEWVGCAKVSRGCRWCYAEASERRWHPATDGRRTADVWGNRAARRLTSDTNRRKPYTWNRAAQKAGVPARVFAASLADVFEDHPDAHRYRPGLFTTIEKTPCLRWMLLTKRIDLVEAMTVERWGRDWPRNVWLGTSVEGQAEADARLPVLLNMVGPAETFASAEPLLEPTRIGTHLATGRRPLSLLIGGGESGPKARYNNLVTAARLLRDDAAEHGVPFYWKQWGTFVDCSQLPAAARAGLAHEPGHPEPHRMGKGRAGRLLDGRTHDGVVESYRLELETAGAPVGGQR